MDQLIIGLLDYSRLSKIKELQEVDCNAIMQEVLTDLDAIIRSSGAKITIEKLPQITAYPLEIRQLFQNLLTNAIKFRRKDIPLKLRLLCGRNTAVIASNSAITASASKIKIN